MFTLKYWNGKWVANKKEVASLKMAMLMLAFDAVDEVKRAVMR